MLVVYLSLILFSNMVAVSSQTTSSSLHGTITDPHEALIPRAKVIAKLRSQVGKIDPRLFETETNDEGQFILRNLPPGVYEVRISFEGSESQTEKIVSLRKGEAVEIAIQLGRGCDKISEGSGLINDSDKAQVVKLTLEQILNPKLGLLEKRQRDEGVILSSKNIKPDWIKDVQGITIKLMGEQQIRRKADREGDFLYMSFPEVRVRGACIVVTITNTWAVGKRSRMVYLSGSGYTYEYRKQSGKWVGKFVSAWVS